MNTSNETPSPAFFCRFAKTETTRANLPHWDQSGVTCFATFRLADALPEGKLEELRVNRAAWLARHPEPWDDATIVEYRTQFDGRVQAWLDAGSGSCILQEPSARQIVERVILKYDRVRYVLYAFVVMPNHVHVLFRTLAENTIPSVLQQWKSVSAHLLNHARGTQGVVWQKESWDTLIRNKQHFDSIVQYIKGNDSSKAWYVYD